MSDMPKEVTKEEEKKALTLQDKQGIVPGFSNQSNFELAMRTAKLLSQSSLVPKNFQGEKGIADCVIAINMAQRMNADPLMVMQNLYVVYGKPSFSSQFLISTFNILKEFSRLKFEYNDQDGDRRACRAYATEMRTGEVCYGSWVSLTMAKAEGWYGKSGSKWQTMPDQMMMYRAASFFIRVYAPEISMGMQTTEEIYDVYDKEKENNKQERLAEIEKKGKVNIFDLEKKLEEPKQEIEVAEEILEKENNLQDEIIGIFGDDE